MRTLKILVVVALTLGISAAAVWIWIRHAADQKWAAAQERIRELAAAHPVVLPPMPSTPAPKEIQIQFVAAIRSAVRRGVRQPNLVELQESMGTGAVEFALEDAQEFLELLHRAGRQCAASPSDFPPGWRGEWDTTTLRHIIDCGVLRARQLREQKRPFDAAETLLDTLQLARFWTVSGKGESQLTALKAMSGPLDDLQSVLSKEALTREHLGRLERELEPLDQALPSPVDALDPALARWAEPLISTEWRELPWRQGIPYRWRYILPFPLMKAQAFESAEFAVLRMRAAAATSYPQLLRTLRQIETECSVTKNPIVEGGLPLAHPMSWLALQRSAQLRLCRTAAHYRATGDVLPLKDPLGDKFRQSENETRMRFWSPGPDGVDDGGAREKDLVIEADHPKPE